MAGVTILGVATSKRLEMDKSRRRFAPGGGFPQRMGRKRKTRGPLHPRALC